MFAAIWFVVAVLMVALTLCSPCLQPIRRTGQTHLQKGIEDLIFLFPLGLLSSLRPSYRDGLQLVGIRPDVRHIQAPASQAEGQRMHIYGLLDRTHMSTRTCDCGDRHIPAANPSEKNYIDLAHAHMSRMSLPNAASLVFSLWVSPALH